MINRDDFIEIEFVGKVKNGEVFDTNIKEECEKIKLEVEARPLIICIGQNMILPAIDEFLIGKETGTYTLELAPEKAFGNRDVSLIKTMPLRVFTEKNIVPQQGMMFNFDTFIGKVTSVSGGRVIVDFNNPLAGKIVVYELNIKRKVADEKEKVASLMLFFFKKKFDFILKNKKIIIKAEASLKPLFDIFKPKFKEILNLDLETEEQNKPVEKITDEKASEKK